MKYFSVAIVAAFLFAVVTAAPSSPNPSFEDLTLDPVAVIANQFKEYEVDLECVRDVVTEVLGNSKVKGKWEETKHELDQLVNVELKKCEELKDPLEIQGCKLGVVLKGVELVVDFLHRIYKEDRDLFEKLRDEIFTKCLKEHVLLAETVPRDASITDQFQCLVDVLEEVSKTNGMEEIWSKSQPELQNHLDSWKQCANADGKLQIIMCNIREGIATFKLMVEYMQMMATQNPNSLQDFARLAQEKCNAQVEEIDLFLADDENKSERLKCIADAINEAIKETDYEKIWEKTRDNLMNVGERMKSCRTEQNVKEMARCIGKELSRAHEILHKFLLDMKQANTDTYMRIRDYIKNRCMA